MCCYVFQSVSEGHSSYNPLVFVEIDRCLMSVTIRTAPGGFQESQFGILKRISQATNHEAQPQQHIRFV